VGFLIFCIWACNNRHLWLSIEFSCSKLFPLAPSTPPFSFKFPTVLNIESVNKKINVALRCCCRFCYFALRISAKQLGKRLPLLSLAFRKHGYRFYMVLCNSFTVIYCLIEVYAISTVSGVSQSFCCGAIYIIGI